MIGNFLGEKFYVFFIEKSGILIIVISIQRCGYNNKWFIKKKMNNTESTIDKHDLWYVCNFDCHTNETTTVCNVALAAAQEPTLNQFC